MDKRTILTRQELTLPASLQPEKLRILNGEIDLSEAYGWFGLRELILYAPAGSRP